MYHILLELFLSTNFPLSKILDKYLSGGGSQDLVWLPGIMSFITVYLIVEPWSKSKSMPPVYATGPQVK